VPVLIAAKDLVSSHFDEHMCVLAFQGDYREGVLQANHHKRRAHPVPN
jgi:hypothetical protein